MHITVFGATGAVGSRVVTEAENRGHTVTAVTRSPTKPQHRRGDASNVDDVVRLSGEVVISATRPQPGQEHELAEVARTLLEATAKTGARLLVVGGAGSLNVAQGGTVEEQEDFPAELKPIANACTEQLNVFRDNDTTEWTYLSPPAVLEPGERTGKYRTGADDLIVDEHGNSWISMEDFAVALLDEVERPRNRRTRFTVGH
jgi:uncharacterized protein